MTCPQLPTNLPIKLEPGYYWPIIEMETLFRPNTPQSAKLAVQHLFKARSARSSGNIETSLKEYKNSMVHWFEADAQQPSLWSQALHFTNMEYASLLLGQ